MRFMVYTVLAWSVAIWFWFLLAKELPVYLKRRRRKKENPNQYWQPPFRCKIFGHLWERTPLLVDAGNPISGSVLEICDRCGGGRAFGLFEFRHFIPASVKTYLSQVDLQELNRKAEDAGKIVSLKKK